MCRCRSFSARLPEICDTVNRKLGGPTAQTPAKEKYARPALPVKSKPGARAKRPLVTKSDRDLERILSKERMRRSVSRGPSGAIALLRSASATTISGLKREESEGLMGMIPKRETSCSLSETRDSVFSRSTSSAGTDDVKAKKTALVQAELRNAISALKRPNRAMAGKEIVDEVEQRTLIGLSPARNRKFSSHVAVFSRQSHTGSRSNSRGQKAKPASGPSQGNACQQPLQECHANRSNTRRRHYRVAAASDVFHCPRLSVAPH